MIDRFQLIKLTAGMSEQGRAIARDILDTLAESQGLRLLVFMAKFDEVDEEDATLLMSLLARLGAQVSLPTSRINHRRATPLILTDGTL